MTALEFTPDALARISTTDANLVLNSSPRSTRLIAFRHLRNTVLFGPDDRLIKITHEYANYRPASGGCMDTVIIVVGVLSAIGAFIGH